MVLAVKILIIRILTFTDVVFNYILLKRKKVRYKDYPKIIGKLYIGGSGTIDFGSNVRINSSLRSNPIGGDTRTILCVTKGAKIKIGDNTGISNITIDCKKEVIVGDFVKIGGSVKIYDSDFHSLDFESRKNRKTDIASKKAVELKNNSFIGAHSIILKGVTIGERSIIGAGSVVAKSVPDDEIWGGNPCKFIKKLI